MFLATLSAKSSSYNGSKHISSENCLKIKGTVCLFLKFYGKNPLLLQS